MRAFPSMSRKSKKKPGNKAPAEKLGAPEAEPEKEWACAASEVRAPKLARNDRWRVAGVCVILAALVWAVFGQTLRHEFTNYDDNSYVYQNPDVTRGLTPGGVVQAFTSRELGLWNPLVTISHMLDCQLFGLNAGGHHFSNALLHLASGLLLFLILRRATGALWRSAFVAAAFAIHPLNVESVAWISERKDMLSGLFFMLTWGAYVVYVERPGSLGRYLAVLLLFASGLLCKPMLVTLPFVLLLLDYWPLNRLFLPSPTRGNSTGGFFLNRRAIAEKIPLLGLTIASCVVTVLAPKEPGNTSIEHIPFLVRIGEIPVSVVTYLGQMIRPAGLAVIYPHSEQTFAWWPAALALCVLLSWGIFLLRKNCPYLWMGWLWYLGMLVPVSGIVQISRHARADHYNYLPQIGLFIGVTWAVADWSKEWRYRRWILGILSAGVVLALAVCARTQTAYWRTSESLWTHTLACTNRNPVAHNNLGLALLHKKQVEEATAHFREAVRINPAYSEAHNNLGNALLQRGQAGEATAHFREAVRGDPANSEARNNLGNALLQKGRSEEAIVQFREALRINTAYSESHYNLGNALLQQGQTGEAMAQYREALRINPANSLAHINLGAAFLQKGQSEEAIAHFREAVRITPANSEAHNNLGAALLQKGQSEEAIAQYREAVRINPAYSEAMNNLAYNLATAGDGRLRNGREALEIAERANDLTRRGNPEILETLAAAYAETGRFGEAEETARWAIILAKAQGNPALAGTVQEHLKLYQARRPLRSSPGF